jgi:hypothetical protein
MAESRPNAFDRFGEWYFSRGGKFVCFLVVAGLLALCIGTDQLAREYGRESVWAPTRDDFWRGIEFGGVVGFLPLFVGSIQQLFRFQFRQRTQEKSEELTGWRLSMRYVCVGCHLVLVYVMVLGLFFWCRDSELSFVPPALAMLVVQGLTALLWRVVFSSESQGETAESLPAEK